MATSPLGRENSGFSFIDWRTPWDDLDLDIVIPSSEIPRLKLPTPGFYFALLPLSPYPRDWETRWQKADNAHDMRIVTATCIDHERRILHQIADYRLKDSSSIEAANEAQQTKTKADKELAPANAAVSVLGQSQQLRKRARATKPEILTPTRRSKRIKFAMDKKNGSVTVSPPSLLLPVQIPLDETLSSADNTVQKTTPSKGTPLNQKSPKYNPFNNPNSHGNIVDLHQKIYSTVDAWHDLVLQAEAVEHNLLAIQSQSEVSRSSLRQLDMSKQELEELHAGIQVSAAEVSMELDEASMLAFNLLGFRSPSVTHFRTLDPRRSEVLSYDLELDWQMREMGLFTWWLYHFDDVLL